MPSQMQIGLATKTTIPLRVPISSILVVIQFLAHSRNIVQLLGHPQRLSIDQLPCSLLTELRVNLPTPPVIYCDNVGATYLCSNPVFHSHMKHVAIDYHFIRDQVQSCALRVTHVSSADQLVDALTKPLPRSCFQELQVKIDVSSGAPS